MIKFKKIAAFALAAVTAVSAMSLTAFADDVSKEIVGTFLNEDGEYQTVYVDDIEAGNDTYTLVDGVEIVFSIYDEPEVESNKNVRASTKFTATSKPSYNSTAYSIDGAEYEGSANLTAETALYSNRVVNNGSSAKVMLKVTPQDEDLTDTTYIVYKYSSSGSSTKYFSLNGGTTARSAHTTSAPSDTIMFVKLLNNTDTDRDPYVSISGWN